VPTKNWRNRDVLTYSSQEAHHLRKEVYKCRKSAAYFLDVYGRIQDAVAGRWVPFHLWPAQRQVLQTIVDRRLTVVLKARQMGLTWLVLGYALWLMLFHPAATVLLFSRRDEEAVDLLKVRLRGLYDRLPPWLKVDSFQTDNDHEWRWSNGSRVLAFPTTGGDSYSANLVIVDEADLVPDLQTLMASVKPTIDGGGRMLLVSRVDKGRPNSPFQRIYRAARRGATGWAPVFLPWSDRPDRDQAWYEAVKADVLHRTGALDELHEQYPATDAEALLPRTLDKRIAPQWLQQCFQERTPLTTWSPGAPAIVGLEVYAPPEPGRFYVIGADPAEGNPTSDDSALTVLRRDDGEEVAALAGKFQPSTLAAHIDALGSWYNNAPALVERNNHGHAVLLWLGDHSRLWRLPGFDNQAGWHSTSKGKALLYSAAADAFRDGDTKVHSYDTFMQLASIDGSTLRAPEGEADDRADSFALACVARNIRIPEPYRGPLVYWPPVPFGSEISRDPFVDGEGRPEQRPFWKVVLDDHNIDPEREDYRRPGTGLGFN
jgi:hypothetical protein